MQKLKKKDFHPETPLLEYHKESSNSCCLSSLASSFHSIDDEMAVTPIENRIGEPLPLQKNIFSNKIHFDNNTMKKKL